jgi:acid phosphatase family membrane protein YuiD
METLASYGTFLIPIVVGVSAEIVKFFNYCRKYGWDIRYSIAYGHMPSAHTAFVVSLVTTVAMREGLHSPSFGVVVVMAVIVIMDALRLRVYMGQHAHYINELIHKLGYDEKEFPRLKERVGHKPSEVAGGAVFGFLLTLAIIRLIA